MLTLKAAEARFLERLSATKEIFLAEIMQLAQVDRLTAERRVFKVLQDQKGKDNEKAS